MTAEPSSHDEPPQRPSQESADSDVPGENLTSNSPTPFNSADPSTDNQAETPASEGVDLDTVPGIAAGIGGNRIVILLIIAVISISLLSVMALERRTHEATISDFTNMTADQHYDAAIQALHARHVPDVILHRNALLQSPDQQDRIAVLNAFTALVVDDLTKAADHLKELSESDDPAITSYLYYIAGELAFKQKQYGDALTALDVAVQMSDQAGQQLVPAYQLMASIHYDLGNMQHAMDAAVIVADLDPNNARIFNFIGMVQQDYEQWQDALEAYQRYLEITPYSDQRESVLTSIAEIHMKLAQFPQALNYLNQVLISPHILALRANCEYNLGNVEKARDLLEQTLASSPSQHEAILLKGTILVQDRAYPAAVDLFVSGLRYYPQDDRFMYKLSEAYRGMGDEANAKKYASQSEDLRLKRERFSKLNTDVINQPTNIAMRFELAQLAEAIGKLELAVIWYQAILTIEPGNQQALLSLNRVLEQLTRENTTNRTLGVPLSNE